MTSTFNPGPVPREAAAAIVQFDASSQITMECYQSFLDEATNLVRGAILTVLPEADVATTETAVTLTSALVLDRLGLSEKEFNARLAARTTKHEIGGR